MPLTITPQAAPCGATVQGIDLREPLAPTPWPNCARPGCSTRCWPSPARTCRSRTWNASRCTSAPSAATPTSAACRAIRTSRRCGAMPTRRPRSSPRPGIRTGASCRCRRRPRCCTATSFRRWAATRCSPTSTPPGRRCRRRCRRCCKTSRASIRRAAAMRATACTASATRAARWPSSTTTARWPRRRTRSRGCIPRPAASRCMSALATPSASRAWPDAEAQPLLMELFRHQVREDFVYRHRWQPGMLLMWDNRCVIHAATGGYDGHARLLHRITLAERA